MDSSPILWLDYFSDISIEATGSDLATGGSIFDRLLTEVSGLRDERRGATSVSGNMGGGRSSWEESVIVIDLRVNSAWIFIVN